MKPEKEKKRTQLSGMAYMIYAFIMLSLAMLWICAPACDAAGLGIAPARLELASGAMGEFLLLNPNHEPAYITLSASRGISLENESIILSPKSKKRIRILLAKDAPVRGRVIASVSGRSITPGAILKVHNTRPNLTYMLIDPPESSKEHKLQSHPRPRKTRHPHNGKGISLTLAIIGAGILAYLFLRG